MTDTTMTYAPIAQSGLPVGMPVLGRVQVPVLRASMVNSALIGTDVAVTTGAFPGLHAWSPPS